MSSAKLFSVALFVGAVGCGSDAPSAATTPLSPAEEIARGKTAFVTSCGTCHGSRDGYDLAYFGFPDSVIVRRGTKHVDTATAEQIIRYVHSLNGAAVGRNTPLFQPTGTMAADDRAFWVSLFGTDQWPSGLTAAKLLSLDPRKIPAPVRMPVWSSENDETDWMPETPLADELQSSGGGALRAALDAYYASPSTDRMVQTVAAFQAAIGRSDMCSGEIAFHKRPADCFEARRWMSAFAAIHLVRNQISDPPVEVLDLWWDTGEAAVSMYFKPSPLRSEAMVNGWFYLAYSYAPNRFTEDGGYLGQFLQGGGFPLMASFAALRRMVDPRAPREPSVHAHQFYDALLAMVRAPADKKADALQFSYDYLIGWLDSAAPMDSDTRAIARDRTTQAYTFLIGELSNAKYSETPARLSKLAASRDQLLAKIDATR